MFKFFFTVCSIFFNFQNYSDALHQHKKHNWFNICKISFFFKLNSILKKYFHRLIISSQNLCWDYQQMPRLLRLIHVFSFPNRISLSFREHTQSRETRVSEREWECCLNLNTEYMEKLIFEKFPIAENSFDWSLRLIVFHLKKIDGDSCTSER